MTHFNLKEIELDVDYILSISELGANEMFDDMVSTMNEGISSESIINVFKNSVAIWFFYIKLANKEENYELSSKILKVIQTEKDDAIVQLRKNGYNLKGLNKYLDEIITETKNLMLE